MVCLVLMVVFHLVDGFIAILVEEGPLLGPGFRLEGVLSVRTFSCAIMGGARNGIRVDRE